MTEDGSVNYMTLLRINMVDLLELLYQLDQAGKPESPDIMKELALSTRKLLWSVLEGRQDVKLCLQQVKLEKAQRALNSAEKTSILMLNADGKEVNPDGIFQQSMG
jgi:hypothetical protein